MKNDDIIHREVAREDLHKILGEYFEKGYDVKQISELRKRKKGRYVVVFEKLTSDKVESESESPPAYQLC